jgi:hypothetical protein
LPPYALDGSKVTFWGHVGDLTQKEHKFVVAFGCCGKTCFCDEPGSSQRDNIGIFAAKLGVLKLRKFTFFEAPGRIWFTRSGCNESGKLHLHSIFQAFLSAHPSVICFPRGFRPRGAKDLHFCKVSGTPKTWSQHYHFDTGWGWSAQQVQRFWASH